MPSCLVAAGPRNQQCRRNTTSGLLGLFSDVTLFRMSKCICKPNFVDTPQSTADITIFCIKNTSASEDQIFSKSANPRQRYDVISIFKMAAAAAHFTSRIQIGWRRCLKKIKVYQQTECRRDNLIRGRDITTSGLQKQTFALLEFFSRVQFGPHHRHRNFILHQITKCHPNRTILCRVDVISIFTMTAESAQFYFRFQIVCRSVSGYLFWQPTCGE